MKDKILGILKSELKLHPLKVMCIYAFGSRCYGNHNVDSDYDFIIVAKNSVENVEHQIGEYNFHIQTPDYFQERLDWNDPTCFECLMYPPVLEKQKFKINIVNGKFRHAVSYISSNSWIKAKKKIQQGDIYIGQKSLFHSLRIPMFATQIMKYGDIRHWEMANGYWYYMKEIYGWDLLKNLYQPVRNEIMSEFRQLCEKE